MRTVSEALMLPKWSGITATGWFSTDIKIHQERLPPLQQLPRVVGRTFHRAPTANTSQALRHDTLLLEVAVSRITMVLAAVLIVEEWKVGVPLFFASVLTCFLEYITNK